MKIKKALSILLTLCMLLSVIPMMGITASAANDVCYIDADENGAFDGSDVKYPSITAALEAAGTGESTIRLISNVTGYAEIKVNQVITLDLNGYVLTGDGTSTVIRVNKSGKDGDVDAKLTISDSACATQVNYFTYYSDAKWEYLPNHTATGAEIEFDDMESATLVSGQTVIAVYGGVITGGIGQSVRFTTAGGGIYNLGTLTIKGGNIIGNSATRGAGIHNEGTLSISDTVITGNCAKSEGGGILNGNIFTVGGTTKIIGNIVKPDNGEPVNNNLHLREIMSIDNGKTVSIGTGTGEGKNGTVVPASGMSVGVSTDTAPTKDTPVKFTINGTVDDLQYFTSDKTEYGVAYNSGKYLELVLVYTVTEMTCTNGSVSVGATKSYASGKTVTVTATPDAGYALDTVTAYKTGDEETIVTVTNGTFTMPAYDVTVSATFKAASYVCYIDANENGTFDTGDVKYPSITAALKAAGTEKSTIRLISNVTENVNVTSDNYITLDLNGYVLKGEGTNCVIINDGRLKITDSNPATIHKYVVGEDGLWTWNDDATGTAVPFDSLTSRPTEGTVVSVNGGCITGGGDETSYGGGIFTRFNYLSESDSQVSLSIENINIIGNSSGTGGGGVGTIIGGDNDFSWSANNVRIMGNTSILGGGIYNQGDISLSITDSLISMNTASDSGGGIYTTKAMVMTDCTVSFNEANGTFESGNTGGGGICFDKGSNLVISNCEITDNTAVYNGGGILRYRNEPTYIVDAKMDDSFIMLDTVVENNTAGNQGGGVYYDSASFCFAEGTLITMADGTQKNIEDIVEGEKVKTFDHETGKISSSEVYYAFKGDTKGLPFTLKFDNGNTLSIVGMHDLLLKDTRKYVSITESNAESYIGKYFYGEDGAWHKLTAVAKETVATDFYSIYSAGCQNCFAGGMLSCPDDIDYALNIYELDEDLKADADILKADIEEYGLVSFEVANKKHGMTREWFDALSTKYFYIAVGKGLTTLDIAKEDYLETLDSGEKIVPVSDIMPASMLALAPMTASTGNDKITLDNYIETFSTTYDGYATIGSGTKIVNNTVNGKNNNLWLGKGRTVYLYGDNRSDITVGVTTGTEPSQTESVDITCNGAKKDEAFFFSDNSAYADKFGGYSFENKTNLALVGGFEVTENTCDNGKVNVGDAKSFYEGETVTVTATPNTGYIFDKVTITKTSDSTDVTNDVKYDAKTGVFTMPGYDVTVEAAFVEIPEDVANAKYYASLTLGDSIAINFSAKNTGADFDYTKLICNVDGTEYSVDEKASCTLASKAANKMADEITVKVIYDGVTVKTFTYSVAKYCKSIIGNAKYNGTAIKDLCVATLNYGAYAEAYFDGKTDNLVNAGNEWAAGLIDTEVDAPTPSLKGNTVIDNAKASLTLGSAIALNITFDSTATLTADDIVVTNDLGQVVLDSTLDETYGYTFKDNGGGNYTLTINNISASRLSRSYTVSVKGAELTYSALNYCADVQGLELSETITTELKTLCRAIALYAGYAQTYFESLSK